MLITQFILVNAHFVLSFLSALVCFAIAWLYYDAWLEKKKIVETTMFFGFLFLTISFVAQGLVIDQSLLQRSILGADTASYIKGLFRVAAYLTLMAGQILAPLQPLPDYRKTKTKKSAAALLLPVLGISAAEFLPFLYPVLATLTAFLYLRRATVGLENHLKSISLGFFLLAVSELLGTSVVFRGTDNIAILNLVAPFGILWIVERIFMAAGIFVLGTWIWSYLLKRFDAQLFMIFTTTTLVVFLTTAIFYTFASLKNSTNESYKNLETDVAVLNYSIESKKEELLSAGAVIVQDGRITQAVIDRDKNTLAGILTPMLLAKKQSSLVVTAETGEVIFRAEDPESFGGSLSDNSVVKRTIAGNEATGISTKDGVMSPVVVVSAGVPIKKDGAVVGTVLIGYEIDNAFADGVKSATGLDASIYADNVRSATTFVAPDGKSRWIGIKEENDAVKKSVLGDNKAYTGATNILNVPYFASYLPLKDADGNPVGMLFAGRPQVALLQSAASSIELTFVTTAILLVLSIAPAYFVSRYISSQIN